MKGRDDSCIIWMMFDLFKQMGERATKSQKFTKQDILMLGIVDSNQKYKIEKSQCYIGYKLLWIMKMYLEGRQFPFGSLPQEQWKKNVIKIAKYVAMSKFTSELLEFDASAFLDVI
jgi:hypothetical protein